SNTSSLSHFFFIFYRNGLLPSLHSFPTRRSSDLDDLLHWEFHPDPGLLIYDYAPDVRQVGEYLYFCASRKGKNCPILRSKDPLHEPFEQVSAPFAFWDPDLFLDDDGRVYLYWGCSNTTPIWGVEMDPKTM